MSKEFIYKSWRKEDLVKRVIELENELAKELKEHEEFTVRMAEELKKAKRPAIKIQDTESGRVFDFGGQYDVLVISEDGRALHYYNLQCGEGSKRGGFRFYYEKSGDYRSEFCDRMITNKTIEE